MSDMAAEQQITFENDQGLVYRYLCTERLGGGSYGSVLKGKQLSDDLEQKTEVAVKLMHKETTPERINELKFLTSLDHPNIIKYLAMGRVIGKSCLVKAGGMCLVMEYCGDGTLDLKEYVGNPENPAVPTQTITLYIKQLLKALSYMHGKQLYHCDLKSENILLTLNETVLKICDLDSFGRLVGSHTTRTGWKLYFATNFY